MANQIVILHTKVGEVFADKLLETLKRAGFNAITFGKIIGDLSHSEIQEAWFGIASKTPLFIISGSPELVFNRQITELSLDAISAKKAICVVLGSCPRLPAWFTYRAITIEWGNVSAWNRLTQSIQKYTPIFPRLN